MTMWPKAWTKLLYGLVSGSKLVMTAAAGSYLAGAMLLRTIEGGSFPGRTLPVLVACEGRRQLIRALADTGNHLTDPLTGAPVLVVDEAAARRILPPGISLGQRGLRSPAEALATLSGVWEPSRLRLLPYRSVGVPNGLLLAVRVDSIEVNGRPFPGTLAAVMPGELEPGVHGLIGV